MSARTAGAHRGGYFQPLMMVEVCFNFLNALPVSSEFIHSIRIDLHWNKLLGPCMKVWVPYSNHTFCLSTVFVDTTVGKVFKLPYPNWVCGPPMRGRCAWTSNYGPVTFDFGAMTLNLGFLWTLLCPSCWYQCGLWTIHNGWMCMGMEFG